MAKRASRKKVGRQGNGANLGFEEKLWAAADKLRGHMDAAEYKHVVLGIVFLKYISDAFQELYDRLSEDELSEPEDRDDTEEDCPKEKGQEEIDTQEEEPMKKKRPPAVEQFSLPKSLEYST